MKKIGTDYWYGKNVLITGINGFIGGNLTKLLLEKGANVFGLIRNAKHDTLLFYEKLNERITLIEGHVTDKDLLARIISEEQIQSVFHLAAQVGRSWPCQSYLTFETNIRGTYSLSRQSDPARKLLSRLSLLHLTRHMEIIHKTKCHTRELSSYSKISIRRF